MGAVSKVVESWHSSFWSWLLVGDRDGIQSHQGIRLQHDRRDRYRVETVGSAPLAAPKQRVTLDAGVDRFEFVTDEQGRLPATAEIAAKPGQRITLRGAKGRAFTTIHAPDPTHFLGSERTEGDLAKELKAAHFEPAGFQGRFADCWALASINAIAASCPEVLEGSFAGCGGRVGVRLFDFDPGSSRFIPTSYLVDGRLPWSGVLTKKSLRRLSALRRGPTHAPDPHLWIRLFEKAMANRRGSFEGLNAGPPAAALEALMGARAATHSLANLSDEAILRLLKEAVEQRRPIVVTSAVGLTTRLRPNHAYAMTALTEHSNGGPWVQLHDPGGFLNPELPVAGLRKWVRTLTIGPRPPEAGSREA